MAATPGPSNSETERNFVLQELRPDTESAHLLKRILQKTGEEEKSGSLSDPLERVYFLTGLDKRIFRTKKSHYLQKTEIKDIERSAIQQQLIRLYLDASSLGQKPEYAPTTKKLFTSLYKMIPHYVDIRTFRKKLAEMGYVWLKASNGYIVMERPSVTFERYHYLKDVIKYRQENREIFYVDETVLTVFRNYYDLKEYNKLMKAAENASLKISHKGLLKNIYAVSKTGVYALKTVDNFTTSEFVNWILNELIPVLPEKSVVVIKNAEHHDDSIKKPTLFSTKADVINWLELHNVPFDKYMSKFDLVDLMDNYTSKTDEISKIKLFLQLNGHELLRLPVCIEKVSPAKDLFELIKLNAPKVDPEGDIFKTITESDAEDMLKDFDLRVAILERDTFKVDLKMDEVFDDVVQKFQNDKINFEDFEDSEVPYSDSD